MTVIVTLEPGHQIEVSLRQIINAAQKMLLTDSQKSSLFVEGWYKEVFGFLKACILGLLQLGGDVKEVYVGPRYSLTRISPKDTEEVVKEIPPRSVPFHIEEGGVKKVIFKTHRNLESEEYALRKLLLSTVLCAAHEDIKAEVTTFLVNIAVHFSLLYITKKEAMSEKLVEISPSIFVDVLVDACTTENQELCAVVKKMLDTVLQVCSAYCGGKEEMSNLLLFSELSERACLSCNRYEWYNKAGGCFLISYLSENLDLDWVRRHEASFIKGLLFIIRELTPSISITTVDEATNTLLVLIRLCHQYVFLYFDS